MQIKRDDAVRILRRAGLRSVAEEVEKCLPEEIEKSELDRFLAPYGITPGYLMELMGASG